MVTERLFSGFVNPKALVGGIVIHPHGPALPIPVALDTEVVVPLYCKGRQPGT